MPERPMTDHALPILTAGTPSNANGGHCGCGSHAEPESPSKQFWRSLDDKNETPEFQRWSQNEFQSGASELDGEDRRSFIKLMGASMALAGFAAAGCRRWPEQHLHEYATRPENRTPGTPVKYATSWDFDGAGRGIVATSVDGRPIKVDGNPKHSSNLGSSDSITQATVLELYDPQRARTLLRKGQPSSMTAFREWCLALPKDGLAILSEPFSSPTLAEMRARLTKKFGGAQWFEWSASNDDNERQGTAIAFGSPMRPVWNLADAQVIVSFDSDFLLGHPNAVRNARDFSAGRRIDNPDPKQQSMNRLYVVESALTLTGMNADERIAVRSCDVAAIAAMVAKEVGAGGSDSSVALGEHDTAIAKEMVKDLKEARGRSLVIAGAGQPAAVHALVALINEKLGNRGSTVSYVPHLGFGADKTRTASGDIAALVKAMNGGSVKTLVIVGGNPAYDAPADAGFAAALAKVPEVVHLSFYANETSALAGWVIPRAHYLESWGDSRAWDGTIAPQQPLIEPMIARDMGGISAIELCAELMNEDPRDGLSLVRRTWMAVTKSEGNAFTTLWRTALNDGVVANTAWPLAKPDANAGAVAQAMSSLAKPSADAVEVTFAADPKVYDGRFANIGWLQELPDPVSKLTWDNAAYMSVAEGERLGVKSGDRVNISAGGRSMSAAAWLLPGMADRSVRLHLGYGRTSDAAGTIAKDAGFNAYPLRASDAMSILVGATVAKGDGRYPFAHTQDHGAADAALKPEIPQQGVQERLPSLVREDTLAGYRGNPGFAEHRTHVPHRLSLFEESNLDGARFRWAMSVDLSTCIGCSACVTACQAENNIPIVGKEQVMRGREMHWMRIDRYFKGDDAKRPVAYAIQPVACQHCENAPCEQVCPVAATTHDKDGLNVMVYNRCIGTRYCSNNCPYKVRRFNFFNFHDKHPDRETGIFVVDKDYYWREGPNEWMRMQFNPDVTVRSRGVMEKCTFCVQRIMSAKVQHKNAWAKAGGAANSPTWSIPDGAITPACADACPTQAIVFGDLNDANSRIAKLHRDERSYGLLEELNTKPRLKYLARVRNPSASETLMQFGTEHGHASPGHEGSGHDAGHGAAGETHSDASIRTEVLA
ncbi:MAG: TAT-variant-translocated molybdopterin oxidoreductase [Phycisphaerales bacterium]